MLLALALLVLLVKSNILVKSNLSVNIKFIHIALFVVCTSLYIWMKRRLEKKVENIKLIKGYCYLYLAVMVFVTRLLIVFGNNENIVELLNPGFNIGLGSYLNYGLASVLNNQMYANVIINSGLLFASCIFIKKIIMNITENDVLGTVTALLYVFLPQTILCVTEYTKYSYNVLVVLIGLYIINKIIDEVKNFNDKNNKYLKYSIILGAVQSVDIILGGSYVFWICVNIFTTLVATYIDLVHIKFKEDFKTKLNYKLKRIAEKVEKIGISKLICVSEISLLVSGITCLIYSLVTITNNYEMHNVITSLEQAFLHSRNYYIALIVCALVFEVISVILKRKTEIKMFLIKIAFVTSVFILAFMTPAANVSAVFDVLAIMIVIINICNICYNREERIKLLKDKN